MDACPRGVYRPRRPRATGFYRLVEERYEEFERVYPERYQEDYGPFRPVIGKVVRKYLACGDLRQGFARVRCPDCGHEYLLAYSCKGRYFCTSCHTKRAAAFAERLTTTVLKPVPHRQIVFTLPKMLRVWFRNDRRLLGDLCRIAASVVTDTFRTLLGRPDLTPGMVISVQTFGNFANFHPHLHTLVTNGGFAPSGTLHVLPKVSLAGMEEFFRHRVLGFLLARGRIRPERVRLLLGWRHSGFSIDASVRVGAHDDRARESLARYLIRAPFSVGKLTYLPGKGAAIYKTKMVGGVNRNFQVYDSLDFLAAATSHIPDPWEHLVRYDGWYSSVARGKRRKGGTEPPEEPKPEGDDSPSGKISRANWARFIKKVYEVDPLLCPDCGGTMRIISFIEIPNIIRKILRHLGLWDDGRPPPDVPQPAPPPPPVETVYVIDDYVN